MPDFTIASAIPRIISSLTLQPNLFQLFHPMGGVSARLADGAAFCAKRAAQASIKTAAHNRRVIVCISCSSTWPSHLYQRRRRAGREVSIYILGPWLAALVPPMLSA